MPAQVIIPALPSRSPFLPNPPQSFGRFNSVRFLAFVACRSNKQTRVVPAFSAKASLGFLPGSGLSLPSGCVPLLPSYFIWTTQRTWGLICVGLTLWCLCGINPWVPKTNPIHFMLLILLNRTNQAWLLPGYSQSFKMFPVLSSAMGDPLPVHVLCASQHHFHSSHKRSTPTPTSAPGRAIKGEMVGMTGSPVSVLEFGCSPQTVCSMELH